MATNENLIPIPGRLHSVASEGHVTGADEIYDDTLQKDQATINQEVNEAIGTGGSVDSKISAAINALDASVSKSAGADGLALSVTEENGKLTAVSGSIAANTYDTYGSASVAQSAAISAAAADATTKVNAAKAEIKGSATSACDTLGEAEALIASEASRAGNAETALSNRITPLEAAVGQGGSIDNRISGAIDELDATASQTAANANGHLNLSVTEENGKITGITGSIDDAAYIEAGEDSAVIADFDPQTDTVWKKAQTLSAAEKVQVQSNIGVREWLNNLTGEKFASYTATSQTTAVTQLLPATGATDTIYRVGKWDGTQYNEEYYSDYAWDGSAYVQLNKKSIVGEVFDISEYHSGQTYATLSAALDSNNNGGVPANAQKGGMSVKYVNTDNKYLQFRCKAQSFTTNVTQWINVEEEINELEEEINGEHYGYPDFQSLNNLVSVKDVYYISERPLDGIVSAVDVKVVTGSVSILRVSAPQLGGAITYQTLVTYNIPSLLENTVVRIPLNVELATNEYIGIKGETTNAWYFGQAEGYTLYRNNGSANNYSAAISIIGKGVIDNINKNITNLNNEVEALKSCINGNINIIDTIAKGSISSSGIVENNTPSMNLYIAKVSYGNVTVSNGDLYGFFNKKPTIGSTTLDNTRHIETLNNTIISIPLGTNYIAVRANSEPSIIYTESISQQITQIKENSVFDIKNVSSDIAMFENVGFCGDSYMAGMIAVSENPTVNAQNTNLCWGKILERTHGIISSVYAKGGTSTVDVRPTNPCFLYDNDCLPKLLSESAKNLYVISLGHNDCYISSVNPSVYGKSWTKEEFLAEFNTNYRSIISQIASHAPNAKIILCKQSGPYAKMGWGADINNTIGSIGEDLGLPVLDPQNDKYLSSSIYEDTMVHKHPTFAGYAGIAKAFDRQFCWATVEYFDYFKGYTGL